MAGGSLEVLAGEGRKKGKLLRWTEATKRGRGGRGGRRERNEDHF